jgi:hypothetical protein
VTRGIRGSCKGRWSRSGGSTQRRAAADRTDYFIGDFAGDVIDAQDVAGGGTGLVDGEDELDEGGERSNSAFAVGLKVSRRLTALRGIGRGGGGNTRYRVRRWCGVSGSVERSDAHDKWGGGGGESEKARASSADASVFSPRGPSAKVSPRGAVGAAVHCDDQAGRGGATPVGPSANT